MSSVVATHGIAVKGINHLKSNDASLVKMDVERHEGGDRNVCHQLAFRSPSSDGKSGSGSSAGSSLRHRFVQ